MDPLLPSFGVLLFSNHWVPFPIVKSADQLISIFDLAPILFVYESEYSNDGPVLSYLGTRVRSPSEW